MRELTTGASVERIYVHKSIYDEFLARLVEIARRFQLGDPLDKNTSLGPVVSLASASRIRRQVNDAGE
jgi:acyl-CoA reductase-like NAD-dependent aldehyde dehydrogenase